MAKGTAQAEGAAGLRVRIGHTTVNAADTKAVADAIAVANQRASFAGVPDGLNPRLIDPARAQALLAAVAALPAAARASLGHRALLLDTPGLPVMASSPSTPAGLSGLTGIKATVAQGDATEVRLTMTLDCDLARANATAARTAVEAASADVARLEKERRTATGEALTKALDDLGAARRRRFLLSIAWHDNAEADAACRPKDAEAKAGLAAAAKARTDFVVSTGG